MLIYFVNRILSTLTILKEYFISFSFSGSPSGPRVNTSDVREEDNRVIPDEQPHLDLSEMERSIQVDGTINLSTISRALSEASLSSDPQHFVNMILSCLKRRASLQDKQDSGGGAAATDGLDNVVPVPESHSHESEVFSESNFISGGYQPEGGRTRTPKKSLKETPYHAVSPKIAKYSRDDRHAASSNADPKSRNKESAVQWAGLPSLLLPDRPVRQAAGTQQQQSNSVSEPATPRDTPTPPPLAKSSSLPYSLDTSKRRCRRPSGARHSSPVKTVPQQQLTMELGDSCGTLEHLLEKAAHTPDIFVTTSKLIHTSTPFHPNLNLSTVIMDSLIQNRSFFSPLTNPDLSICPAHLELSTVSPALFSTLKVPVKHVTPRGTLSEEIQLAVNRKNPSRCVVELVPTCDLVDAYCSHVWHTVRIPVSRMAGVGEGRRQVQASLRLSQVWVGSVEVPLAHWPEVLSARQETPVDILPQTAWIEFDFAARGEGAFAISLGLIMAGESGAISSTLLRFRVEEPSVALLTSNGESVDFGLMANDCLASSTLLVVNGGASTLPIGLEITSPTDMFSFAENGVEKKCDFVVPGKKSDSRPEEGVAKEVRIWASTKAMSEFKDPRVFISQLDVQLKSRGADGGVKLGSVKICVRVCFARLVIGGERQLVLSCAPGGKCCQTVVLSSAGTMPLDVAVTGVDPVPVELAFEKSVQVLPGTVKNFDIEFRPLGDANNFGSKSYELRFQLLPGGRLESLTVITHLVAAPGQGFFSAQKLPGLKLGRLAGSVQAQPDTTPVLTRFPVESDRSAVHWFAVEVGQEEIQTIQLRNAFEGSIILNLLIRDSEWFRLYTQSGHATSCQLTLAAKETRELRLAFVPKGEELARGKLVLKPQSIKVGGKCFKASISLQGMGGSAQIKILDVQPRGEKVGEDFEMKLEREAPVTQQLRLLNSGSRVGFVRLMCIEELNAKKAAGPAVSIVPDSFLLGPGELRSVQATFGRQLEYMNPTLVVFSGPELTRRVLRRARMLPGAVRLSGSPALLGLDLTQPVPSEEEFPAEDFTDSLAPEDVMHFYKKTERRTIHVSFPPKMATFDQLPMEETLSESRLHLSTTLVTLVSAPHSPPTTDAPRDMGNSLSHLELLPRQLVLDQGGEAIVKIINNSPSCVHWDLNWPASHLNVSPPAGKFVLLEQILIE